MVMIPRGPTGAYHDCHTQPFTVLYGQHSLAKSVDVLCSLYIQTNPLSLRPIEHHFIVYIQYAVLWATIHLVLMHCVTTLVYIVYKQPTFVYQLHAHICIYTIIHM